MANTKILNLPTDIVTLADADKFPVSDATATTTDTYATALEIKTHGNTAPVFAAGSASANTWPKRFQFECDLYECGERAIDT